MLKGTGYYELDGLLNPPMCMVRGSLADALELANKKVLEVQQSWSIFRTKAGSMLLIESRQRMTKKCLWNQQNDLQRKRKRLTTGGLWRGSRKGNFVFLN